MSSVTAAEAPKIVSKEELTRHTAAEDCWVAIGGHVYNVSKFSKVHPGGAAVLRAVAGRDATEEFNCMHRQEVLTQYARLRVGILEGAVLEEQVSTDGGLSAEIRDERGVPYGESSFWRGFHSPYFTESHDRYRRGLRTFIDTELAPFANKADEDGEAPSIELNRKLGRAGILACAAATGDQLCRFCKENAITLPGGVAPEEMDPFHALIFAEEIRRLGTYGFNDGLIAGISIGLPPVLHFGSEELQQRVATPVLLGEKRICLAISDPYAGSDVAGMMATATKAPDSSYVVNGLKKWITNGTFADYFTTAARTKAPDAGKAHTGISLMVAERCEGLTTKPIKTSSSAAAGTALVVYENVPVPEANLIGKEHQGFGYVMYNFNNERWGMSVAGNRHARLIIEECFKWAAQRKVFGKPLISQPVIRNKLAHMIAEVEAVNNWIESITFQMCKMSPREQARKLAGPIALLKFKQTRAATLVADEACQIFGGRAVTRTGMGQQVERFQRVQKFHSILGGSEEIMADLGVRQAMALWDKRAKL